MKHCYIATVSLLLIIMPSICICRANEKHIEALFAKWDRSDLPGCSLAIVRDGKVVLQKNYGSANLDHEVPNTSKTVFELGSATKSFVSACVAILLDEGKLSPDDEVRKYIPELHQHKTPIRVKDLVRCRSGIWDHWHAMQLAGWMSEPIESPYSQADVLHLLSGQKRLPFQPGSKFKYSSGDFFLLGVIVHRVTGKSLAQFANDRLFKPLGMTRTFFELDSALVVKGRALGYFRDDGKWKYWTTHSGGIGGWGLKTCIDDLVRWNKNFDEPKLPRGKYLTEFFHSGTLLDNANTLNVNAGKPYRDLRRVQFTGGMPGFMTSITRFPDKRLAVLCVANNREIHPWALAEQIADIYFFKESNIATLAPIQKNSKPVKLTPNQLRDKVGAWQSTYNFIFRVVLEDGQLFLIHHLNQKYPLKPLSESRFEPVGYPSPGNTLVFHRVAPDQPYRLSLEWPTGKEHYKPIKLFRPSNDELQQFAGTYFSDELHTTYRFRQSKGKLWLSVNSRAWEALEPTVRDKFIPETRQAFDNRFFKFKRNESGEVLTVSASLFRVSNVIFHKRVTP